MAKILIIDDDPDILSTARIALKSAGYDVATSQDIANAIALAEAEKPALIFLDVMGPENPVAGFEVCRQFRKHPAVADIPIVLFSGINAAFNMGFSEECLRSDVLPSRRFLEKPVSPATLIQVAREILDEKAGRN